MARRDRRARGGEHRRDPALGTARDPHRPRAGGGPGVPVRPGARPLPAGPALGRRRARLRPAVGGPADGRRQPAPRRGGAGRPRAFAAAHAVPGRRPLQAGQRRLRARGRRPRAHPAGAGGAPGVPSGRCRRPVRRRRVPGGARGRWQPAGARRPAVRGPGSRPVGHRSPPPCTSPSPSAWGPPGLARCTVPTPPSCGPRPLACRCSALPPATCRCLAEDTA